MTFSIPALKYSFFALTLPPSLILDHVFNSDVQFGQRVALMGIAVKQNEHSFVEGSGAGGSFLTLFTFFITRKTEKATMRKLIMVLINTPGLTVTAPAAFAAAMLA